MNEEIFRKKSLDRINAVESLDEYIRVANPGVWLLLISVLVLLAGACIWGIFGHVDSSLPVSVTAENGRVSCFVSAERNVTPEKGMTIEFNGADGTVDSVSQVSGGFECVISVDSAPSDGAYEGKLVYDSINPISFILN